MMLSKIPHIILAGMFFISPARALDTLHIEAALDTLHKTISGSISIPRPADFRGAEFQFQLFPNVYSSEDSPYLVRSGGLLTHLKQSGKWGAMEIDSILLGGRNLITELEIEFTRGTVFLQNSWPENESLMIFFRTRIPQLGDRLSYNRDEYLLDGWFPIPAMRNAAGSWYNPDYSGMGELVSAYHHYEIELTIPGGYVVAAPVPPYDSIAHGNDKRHKYRFGPAHDFALAISPHYLLDSLQDGATVLRFFHRESERTALAELKDAIRKTVQFMISRVGPYQYRYLTCAIIDFSFAGGVETPALIFISPPRSGSFLSRFSTMVGVHETTHQWFYGMIGSNQVESPWMDEAISNLFTEKVMRQEYGASGNLVDLFGFKFTVADLYRLPLHLVPDHGPINRPTYLFAADQDYFGVVYFKGALALQTIDNLLGDSLSGVFWNRYYESFLFAHPRPEDFFNLLGEVAGSQWEQTARSLLNGSQPIDPAVANLRNIRRDSLFEASFLIYNTGATISEIDYRAILVSGDTLYEKASCPDGAKLITLKVAAPVLEVEIDPLHKIAADIDLLNNSCLARHDNRPALRLSSGVMFLVESFLSFLGGI